MKEPRGFGWAILSGAIALAILAGCGTCPTCHGAGYVMDATEANMVKAEVASAVQQSGVDDVAEQLMIMLGMRRIPSGTDTVRMKQDIADTIISDTTYSLLTMSRYLTLKGIVERGRIRGYVSQATLDSATDIFYLYGARKKYLRRINLISELSGMK